MALNFKSLLTRALTAGVFVAVLLFGILNSYLSFTLLFFIISIWGLYEFYRITEKLGAKPFKIIGYLTSITLYVSVLLSTSSDPIFDKYSENAIGITIALSFLIFICALFSKNEKPINDVVFTIAGIVYTGIPFALLNKFSPTFTHMLDPKIPSNPDDYYNSNIVLGMILLIWASDTFAYLVGSLMGKRKLYERISPGKTWEGTIGGGVLTLASSYIIAGWFPEIAFVHWLVISALVVVFGTLGDLFESLLKRQAGIKDSGKIMPGHGGILDRFDSLIFVTPFVYLYLSWVLN